MFIRRLFAVVLLGSMVVSRAAAEGEKRPSRVAPEQVAFNRPRGVNLSIKVIEIKLNLKGRDENAVISALFSANAAYKNDAQYELFPFSRLRLSGSAFLVMTNRFRLTS